jgi:hypothetical protein
MRIQDVNQFLFHGKQWANIEGVQEESKKSLRRWRRDGGDMEKSFGVSGLTSLN